MVKSCLYFSMNIITFLYSWSSSFLLQRFYLHCTSEVWNTKWLSKENTSFKSRNRCDQSDITKLKSNSNTPEGLLSNQELMIIKMLMILNMIWLHHPQKIEVLWKVSKIPGCYFSVVYCIFLCAGHSQQ